MDMRTLLAAQGFDTDSLSDDQLAVYHTLFRRRDVRREFAGEVVDRERLMRVLAAAHAAPSVGAVPTMGLSYHSEPGPPAAVCRPRSRTPR